MFQNESLLFASGRGILKNLRSSRTKKIFALVLSPCNSFFTAVMATRHGERHDWNEDVPLAKRRADSNQLEGQAQQATSIVQHASIMANLISFMRHPLDVARLLIATDRFKLAIMSQVSSICFTEHFCCSVAIVSLAQRFFHLQNCTVRCIDATHCMSKGWADVDWPRFSLSLRHLSMPHVRSKVVSGLLGGRDRNLLECLYISRFVRLPFLPSLRRLHIQDIPRDPYFCDRFPDDSPLLETLFIGECFAVVKRASFVLNLQWFKNLRRLEMRLNIDSLLEYIILPPNLEQLTMTPMALNRLKSNVYPNMRHLTVIDGSYKTLASSSPICKLEQMMPNLVVLHVKMAEHFFQKILPLSPDIPASLPRLEEINKKFVADFPECWRYFAQLGGGDRKMNLYSDMSTVYVGRAEADHLAYTPPCHVLHIEDVPLSGIPPQSVHNTVCLSMYTPCKKDLAILSTCPTSFAHLVHLTIQNIETRSLLDGNVTLAPLVSLNGVSLEFQKFQLHSIKKLNAINTLIVSISSSELMTLQLSVSDAWGWLATMINHGVERVRSACIHLPSLLQKHALLDKFSSDVPVIGFDETDAPILHHKISKIKIVIWRGRCCAFQDSHYFNLLNHFMRKTGLENLQKLSANIVQPVWYLEPNSAICINPIPPEIVKMCQDRTHKDKCLVRHYPSLYEPKYLSMCLKLKANIDQDLDEAIHSD